MSDEWKELLESLEGLPNETIIGILSNLQPADLTRLLLIVPLNIRELVRDARQTRLDRGAVWVINLPGEPARRLNVPIDSVASADDTMLLTESGVLYTHKGERLERAVAFTRNIRVYPNSRVFMLYQSVEGINFPIVHMASGPNSAVIIDSTGYAFVKVRNRPLVMFYNVQHADVTDNDEVWMLRMHTRDIVRKNLPANKWTQELEDLCNRINPRIPEADVLIGEFGCTVEDVERIHLHEIPEFMVQLFADGGTIDIDFHDDPHQDWDWIRVTDTFLLLRERQTLLHSFFNREDLSHYKDALPGVELVEPIGPMSYYMIIGNRAYYDSPANDGPVRVLPLEWTAHTLRRYGNKIIILASRTRR